MTEALERSEALVGFILMSLYRDGYKSKPLKADELVEGLSDDQIDLWLMTDVAIWMFNEGLIYIGADMSVLRHNVAKQHYVPNVQITAKGVDLLKTEDARQIIAESGDAGEQLAPAFYTRLGAFVGGMLGGLAKSMG